uniref:Uncharacterized protein n=1 Tax=Knipowitschia caucasica TaxID=637954 RepID=A0AAV2L176_KNICA
MKSGATVNSFPGSSPEPSKGALHNYQADHAIPYHNIGSTPTTPTTDKSHLSPSIAPSFPNTLHLLAASTHFSSPIYEPTESPPDYIFPSDTLDVDWGSGDYLETISYLGSDEKWTISNGTTDVVTPDTPVTWWDQGSTEDGDDIPATVTLLSESTEADTTTTTASTTVTTTPHQGTPKLTTGTEMSSDGSVSHTIKPPATTQPATTQPATTQPATTQPATTQPATTQPATTQPATTQPATTQPATTQPATTQPAKQYLCDVNKPEYLVKIGFPFGATIGYAKSQIRDILKGEFNKSVEIQHVTAPPKFVFRVVSGPVVYTAISVINTLQRSGRRFLSISPSWTLPDYKYQVHTVLQFVPSHIDIRFCNFTENIERGLSRAYAETQRRSKMSPNFTVHIVNITHSPLKSQGQLARQPVDIVFTVRGSRGHVTGSEVSDALLKLTMVEFSYYMGFPVLQIAEPFHYPELNTSQLLRSSWVKTVLLGVMDQKVNEKTFQANVERRVAMLLGEAMGVIRRVKRATTVGNSSVQV